MSVLPHSAPSGPAPSSPAPSRLKASRPGPPGRVTSGTAASDKAASDTVASGTVASDARPSGSVHRTTGGEPSAPVLPPLPAPGIPPRAFAPVLAVRSGLGAGVAHLRGVLGVPTRFRGAWPTREAALAALPEAQRPGYDAPGMAEVAFAQMAQVRLWDYPVIHWLSRIAGPGASVLDAGGHMGTKYIAFARHLDVAALGWTVYDLPQIVASARQAQAAGRVPEALSFVDALPLSGGTVPDVLLASGLLQYLDRPFGALLEELGGRPAHVLLNKVATREGDEVVTLERVGGAPVPYRIRDRAGFEAEIAALGYRIRDRWDIPSLAHLIPTHPHLGRSASLGYLLERL